MIQSTMQDAQLTVSGILKHGLAVYSDSEVATYTGEETRTSTFAQVARRAARLASGLKRLGVEPGDRVGTFCWNCQEHMEAYLAIPSMGAVIHTLNIRLFPEQLAYIINHAEDRVIIVEASLIPLLEKIAPDLKEVKHFIVFGDGDASHLGPSIPYEELLAESEPAFDWPEIDERAAAAMCYTSGTTGNPKGVVYSHRSLFLHSIAACTASTFGLSVKDRVLMIVPMFHACAWGLPYAAWMTGADLIMPGRFLQAEALCRIIAAERPTFAGGVPTIWNDVVHYAETHEGVDLSSLRMVTSGGSAVPRTLIEKMKERHGVQILQAWGMTETSPLGALAHAPKNIPPGTEMDFHAKSGRITAGVEFRLTDGETELPWDGKSIGEIECRGPWVTASYYRDPAPEKFHDGWLRTGDVGTIDSRGYVQITDRAKDVIKSGGEWISSVELETAIMAHPDVLEAAVVGVPDARWDERPLASVVMKPGSSATADELNEFLGARVAKWWIPERWCFLLELPKTSVGKFDKKVLRAQYERGSLSITHCK